MKAKHKRELVGIGDNLEEKYRLFSTFSNKHIASSSNSSLKIFFIYVKYSKNNQRKEVLEKLSLLKKQNFKIPGVN